MSQMVEVEVEQGILRGQRVVPEDGNGRSYDAFRGIPYAQPPVGPLRFKAPRPPEPWEGVRPALEEGSPSCQFSMFTNQFIGDEDCLYLNVYTPQVPSSVTDESPDYRGGSPWPIMFWIHPGGFVEGSGSASEYGPELLLAKDVVVVTINYRLGPLGFLSLGSPAATGNYGMKDVVAALRWVTANGGVFGGDTECITVFGCSAGSVTVLMLQLSPSAEGLFHRAIAQSCSSISHLLRNPNPRERAIRLAQCLGATDGDLKDDESILEFLRDQSPIDLLEGSQKMVTPEEMESGYVFMFVPVSEENLDPDDSEDEIFLPGTPQELLKTGPLIDVPLIIGMTSVEGIGVELLFPPEAGFGATPEVLEKYEQNLAKGLPVELRNALPARKRKEATDQLRKIFFGGGVVDKVGYYNLHSDLIFNTSILLEARMHARQKSSPVFAYVFSVRGSINRASEVLQTDPNELQGACHGDELNYLWNTGPPMTPIPELEPDSLEARTRERIVTLWTNFAKTGNPTPEDETVEGIRWPEVPEDVESSIPYLDFGVELTVPSTGAFQERVEFWDSLYSQLE